jgi:hypothetical protein
MGDLKKMGGLAPTAWPKQYIPARNGNGGIETSWSANGLSEI